MLSDAIPQSREMATMSAIGAKLLNLYAIDVLISALPVDKNMLKEDQFIERDSVKISTYKNPEALPHAYVATQKILVTSLEEASAALSNDSFILGKSVLIEKNTDELTARLTRVTEKRFDEEYIEIESQTDGRAILVIAMTYYPGWQARVDGSLTDIFPVNIRQTGVLIPSGNHTITFAYFPESITLGFLISLASYLFMGFLIWFDPHPEAFRIYLTRFWHALGRPHNHEA